MAQQERRACGEHSSSLSPDFSMLNPAFSRVFLHAEYFPAFLVIPGNIAAYVKMKVLGT